MPLEIHEMQYLFERRHIVKTMECRKLHYELRVLFALRHYPYQIGNDSVESFCQQDYIKTDDLGNGLIKHLLLRKHHN